VLDRICCFKYPRTIGHDNTIQLAGRLVQVHPGLDGRTFAGTASTFMRNSMARSPSIIAAIASARRASHPTNSRLGGPRSDFLRVGRPQIPPASRRAHRLLMHRIAPPQIILGAGDRPAPSDADS
jgi:hypothetical protein